MKTVRPSLVTEFFLSSIVLTYCAYATSGFIESAHAAPTAKRATTAKSSISSPSADDPWAVLKKTEIVKAMKTAMGSSFPLFEQQTQNLEHFEVKGDDMFSHGGVAGLYTEMESAISINKKTNRTQIAILDDGKLNIWGASSNAELTPSMSGFIKDLKSRRTNHKLDTIFQSPGNSTIKITQSPKATNKNVSVKSPTGTYSRDKQWDGATLKVLQLKGNKLKFDISATHGANTGGASGELNLVNNKATYNGEGFKLTFDFRGSSVAVGESGDGFGGMGVTAVGTYKKTDDKAPTFDNIN